MTESSITRTSAPILDTLLRAGLCTQSLFDSMDKLSPIEQDETLDAISQGAIPLPQLTWEWAGTHGHVPLLHHDKEVSLNLEAFNDDLLSITTSFTLQVSGPYNDHNHANIGIMPPFPGQRGRLTNRTNWITIGPPPPTLTAEEIEELNTLAETIDEQAADNPDTDDLHIPSLFAPGLRLGTTRAGETWVRIHPDQLAAFRHEPYELIELLATVSEAHMQQVRDTVKTQALRYEDDAIALNKLLRYMSGWETMTRQALDMLGTLSPGLREERAPGILHILTTFEDPPSHTPKDQRVRTLRQFRKELDQLTKQSDGASVHAIQRWHDRATTYIRTMISTSAADDFQTLRTTDAGAAAMGDALRALQNDLIKHPEHYHPTPPQTTDWRAILLGWYWMLSRPWKILIATIIILAALAVGTWKLIPEEVKVHLLTSGAPHTQRAR